MPAKKYSEEFKKQVIEHVKTGNETMVDIAKKFGIPRMTLYRWLEKENENQEVVRKSQEKNIEKQETVEKDTKQNEMVNLQKAKQAQDESSQKINQLQNESEKYQDIDKEISVESEKNARIEKENQNINNKSDLEKTKGAESNLQEDEFEKQINQALDSIEQEQARGFSKDVTGKQVRTIYIDGNKKQEEKRSTENGKKRRAKFKKIKQRVILCLLLLVCVIEVFAYQEAIIEKIGNQITSLKGTVTLEGEELLELQQIDIKYDKRTQRSTVNLKLRNLSNTDLENLRYTAKFKNGEDAEIAQITLIARNIEKQGECDINLMVDGDITDTKAISLEKLGK